MTPDDVRAQWNAMTPAGRDAWVARKVMGWDKDDHGKDTYCWVGKDAGKFVDTGNMVWDNEWNPSTDIAAAWQVVEKMKERQVCITYLRHPEHPWMAQFLGPEITEAVTAPEAICLAALVDVECRPGSGES